MPKMCDRGTKCSNSICCPHHEGTYRSTGTVPHTLLTLHCMEMSGHLQIPTTFPQERTKYPLNKRLCGPLSWSGCFVTVVNQYCLFCFSVFILACVALLEVHLKISQHRYRDCKIKSLVINRRRHYSI